MISSGVAGPLGALHLPRLWLKVSLEAAGKLAAGYPGLGKGYDQMTCDALGLDAAAVVEFIKANKPTYPAFEAWVRKNGKKLSKADIHRHNLAILGYWFTSQAAPAMRLCHHLHGGMGMDITYPMDRYYSSIKDLTRLLGGQAHRLDLVGA